METHDTRFKTRKAARTHARVLSTAIKLFKSNGFDKTSMRDISAHSKLGLGALYYHFASKDALVQAFYEQVNADVREALLHSPRKQGTFVDELRQFLELKLSLLRPHRELFRVLLRQSLDPSSPLSPMGAHNRATRDANIVLFEELLARGKPELPETERGNYARALWTLHMGLLLYWVMDPSPGQRRTQELLDKLTRGLRLAETFARMPAFQPFERGVISALADLVPDDPASTEPTKAQKEQS